MSSTGELIDIERVTISSEGGRWKSTHRGNSLAAYPTSRPVLRRGDGSNPGSLAGDKVVCIALQRAIAARRVRIEPTARVHREVGGLLHRFDGEIPRRLDDHGPLATDPGNKGGPVFVIVAPARLALLAASTRAASQGFLPTLLRLALLAGGVIEFIRFARPLHLAVHLIGERGIAQPPAPTVARPDMHPYLSGDAA